MPYHSSRSPGSAFRLLVLGVLSTLFFLGVSLSMTPRTKLESKHWHRVIESPQKPHLFGQLMSVCPSAKPHNLHFFFRDSAITKESSGTK